MCAEDLWKDLEPHLKRWPLISNQPGEEPDGNAILYLGFFVAIYCLYFERTEKLRDFVTANYADCRKYPGVISRGSHKFNDTEEHDDYIGLSAASFLSGEMETAKDICLHGMQNFWEYDEGVYKKKSRVFNLLDNWYGRFIGIPQHFKLCANVRLSFFDKILLALSFLFLGNNQSMIQLNWLRARVYESSEQRNSINDFFLNRWKDKLIKKYPNGMGEVFAIYFRGKNHVFSKWMGS